MKKIIGISFILAFFSFLSFKVFMNLQTNKVSASAITYKLCIEGDEYELPVYVYRGLYDIEERICNIDTARWIYPEGISKPESKYWRETCFEILDFESYQLFINSDYSGTYYIEQEDYFTYYDDALSNSFLIVSYEDIFSPGQQLNGYTKRQLLDNYEEIEGIYTAHEEEINIELVDYGTPVINGYEGVYISNVDNPATIEEIKSCLKAYDNIDGNITDKIIVKSDEYSDNIYCLGEYEVVFEVTDNSNNTATLTIVVHVLDLVDPVIEGKDTIQSPLSNPFKVDGDILQYIEMTDNYDEEVGESLRVIEDNYTANKNTPGIYQVTYQITDTSGNTASLTVSIVCYDDIKPTLSGNQTYTKSTEIPLQISDIMSDLQASDNYDGDISERITVREDRYTGNERKIGNYDVIFYVKDYSGNESDDFTVTVEVKDITLPYFTVSNSIINISEYSKMSKEQIISFMEKCGQIDASKEPSVTFIVDEYSENTNTPGSYKMTAKVKYKNGEEKTVDLTINVKKNLSNDRPEENVNISFFARVLNWFKNIFNSLRKFLTELWNKLLSQIK